MMKLLVIAGLLATIGLSKGYIANEKAKRSDDITETLKISEHLFWENIGMVSDTY